MGLKTKLANGPNPLSVKRRKTGNGKKDTSDSLLKKRRKRAGTRGKLPGEAKGTTK